MKKHQQISDSELEIMRIIWNSGGSALLADIMASLNKKDDSRSQNTILTLLARLIDKGVLSTIKHGRINEYVAEINEQSYIADQTKNFVNKVCGGDAKHLVSSLLKQDYISAKDMEELNKFWMEGMNADE